MVIGAGGSAARNFIECLRMAPEEYFIIGADSDRFQLEACDADLKFDLPRADENEGAWITQVAACARQIGVDVVHSQPDEGVKLLSQMQYAPMSIPGTMMPNSGTVKMCQDKGMMALKLTEAKQPVPAYKLPMSAEEMHNDVRSLLSVHEKVWIRARRGAGSRASLFVTEPEQAVQWAWWWVRNKGLDWSDFMLTEFLPGQEFAFQSIWKGGEMLTSAARQRVSYLFGNLSPTGQSSSPSVAVSVHNSCVNHRAEAAVRAVDPWATGVFCVDLKCTEHGEPYVTEINAGRFFTTSNFFAHLGANMPHQYVQLAAGKDPGPMKKYNAVPADHYWVRCMDRSPRLLSYGDVHGYIES